MLQQTTVAAVLPYYDRWLRAFPDVESLAAADEERVLAAWAGLGYYRRARLLHAAAKRIVAEGWPQSVREWRGLPGVGAYTAGAVASIAFGKDEPAVDGNVERLYARLAADGRVGTGLNRAAWAWARSALPTGRAAEWNQALMELGATVCRPREPLCARCPLARRCRAFAEGRATEFPRRQKRPPSDPMGLIVWATYDKESVWLSRRAEGGWWAGLWCPPFSKSVAELRSEFPRARPIRVGTVSAVVTKHRLTLEVWRAESGVAGSGYRSFPSSELTAVAIPAPFRRALALTTQLQGILGLT